MVNDSKQDVPDGYNPTIITVDFLKNVEVMIVAGLSEKKNLMIYVKSCSEYLIAKYTLTDHTRYGYFFPILTADPD